MCLQPDLRPIDSAGSHGGGRRKAQRWQPWGRKEECTRGDAANDRWLKQHALVGRELSQLGSKVEREDDRQTLENWTAISAALPGCNAMSCRLRWSLPADRAVDKQRWWWLPASGRRTSHGGGERLCDDVIMRGELGKEEEDGCLQLHAPVVRVCSLSRWGIEERVWKKTAVCSFCGWGGWERVTARSDPSKSKADFIYFWVRTHKRRQAHLLYVSLFY
jgi:hypothetical protein